MIDFTQIMNEAKTAVETLSLSCDLFRRVDFDAIDRGGVSSDVTIQYLTPYPVMVRVDTFVPPNAFIRWHGQCFVVIRRRGQIDHEAVVTDIVRRIVSVLLAGGGCGDGSTSINISLTEELDYCRIYNITIEWETRE